MHFLFCLFILFCIIQWPCVKQHGYEISPKEEAVSPYLQHADFLRTLFKSVISRATVIHFVHDPPPASPLFPSTPSPIARLHFPSLHPPIIQILFPTDPCHFLRPNIHTCIIAYSHKFIHTDYKHACTHVSELTILGMLCLLVAWGF